MSPDGWSEDITLFFFVLTVEEVVVSFIRADLAE